MDGESQRADRWQQQHAEAIRTYRVAERREAIERPSRSPPPAGQRKEIRPQDESGKNEERRLGQPTSFKEPSAPSLPSAVAALAMSDSVARASSITLIAKRPSNRV